MPRFDSSRHPDVQVHESAYVDEPCEIGAGTKIWHFSHVMANSRIGERCNLGQNVLVSPGVVLGDNVKVQNNVAIYTGVVLEDDVFCGPSMVFTNINNPRSEIVRRDQYEPTIVRTGASLGANSTVVCGSEVGRFAFIGAGAVVTKIKVPDYALMVGVPAKRIGWVCRCGIVLPSQAPGRIACKTCGNEYDEVDGALRAVKEVQDNDSASQGAVAGSAGAARHHQG